MSERAQPILRLVDPETGEYHDADECPKCSHSRELVAGLEDQVAGLQKDLTAWRLRYANLARDLEAEMSADNLYPVVERVFDIWRMRCRHPRSKLSHERFTLARPFAKRDGEALMIQAVEGAAFDPFVTTRKNGSEKRHDGWELIFRDRGKFEEMCNRAPRK